MPKIKISSAQFAALISAYFTFALNIDLAGQIISIFKMQEVFNVWFAGSIPLFFLAGFNLIFLPICAIKYLRKIFFIALIILSAAASYAAHYYGIIFDCDMITNILETDRAEATSYLNFNLIFWMAGFGMLPSILIYRAQITDKSFKSYAASIATSALISATIIGLIAAFFYKDYAATARNNHSLGRKIIPIYYINHIYKYVAGKYFISQPDYCQIAPDAKCKRDSKKPKLVVIIAGETARSMNYELDGYHRPTNQHTRSIPNMFYFKNTTSCGTSTAVSIPCMFSLLNQDQYSYRAANNQDNLLDILQRAGVQVLWIENNSDCKGVCKNVPQIDVRSKYANDPGHCPAGGCTGGAVLDSAAAQELKNYLASAKKSANHAVVLHIMGSHGPTYYQRYSQEFNKFQPSCDRSDIQNCTQESIVNTYDNTILYTDYIMSEITRELQKYDKDFDTSMIYMSDHGESLGEGGLYLHGMPRLLAPKQQTSVPFMVWLSDGYIKSQEMDIKRMRAVAQRGGFSHDNLFHTILGMFNVSTKVYDDRFDVFSNCSNN